MTLAVVYTGDAAADIDEAFDWLAERAPQAALDFLLAIRRAEVHLGRNPTIYRIVRRGPRIEIRRLNLRPFRYQLYFQIFDTEVIVIACLHAHRSPRVHARIVSDRG
jgi:plasmid stabilization system protein ParE